MSKLDHLTTAQAGLFTEADLLGPEPSPDDASSQTNSHDHAVVTAPILTGDALDILGMAMFPQRALYGRVVSQHGNGVPTRPENSRLFINTNAPFSALVCGVQVRECRSLWDMTSSSFRALEKAIVRRSCWKVS
jgi:hypothetical protein